MSLLALPPEIIQQIASCLFLPPLWAAHAEDAVLSGLGPLEPLSPVQHEEMQDLVSLASTCRYFRDALRLRLFERVCVDTIWRVRECIASDWVASIKTLKLEVHRPPTGPDGHGNTDTDDADMTYDEATELYCHLFGKLASLENLELGFVGCQGREVVFGLLATRDAGYGGEEGDEDQGYDNTDGADRGGDCSEAEDWHRPDGYSKGYVNKENNEDNELQDLSPMLEDGHGLVQRPYHSKEEAWDSASDNYTDDGPLCSADPPRTLLQRLKTLSLRYMGSFYYNPLAQAYPLLEHATGLKHLVVCMSGAYVSPPIGEALARVSGYLDTLVLSGTFRDSLEDALGALVRYHGDLSCLVWHSRPVLLRNESDLRQLHALRSLPLRFLNLAASFTTYLPQRDCAPLVAAIAHLCPSLRVVVLSDEERWGIWRKDAVEREAIGEATKEDAGGDPGEEASSAASRAPAAPWVARLTEGHVAVLFHGLPDPPKREDLGGDCTLGRALELLARLDLEA